MLLTPGGWISHGFAGLMAEVVEAAFHSRAFLGFMECLVKLNMCFFTLVPHNSA